MEIVSFFMRFMVWPLFVVVRCHVTKVNMSNSYLHSVFGLVFLGFTVLGVVTENQPIYVMCGSFYLIKGWLVYSDSEHWADLALIPWYKRGNW